MPRNVYHQLCSYVKIGKEKSSILTTSEPFWPPGVQKLQLGIFTKYKNMKLLEIINYLIGISHLMLAVIGYLALCSWSDSAIFFDMRGTVNTSSS